MNNVIDKFLAEIASQPSVEHVVSVFRKRHEMLQEIGFEFHSYWVVDCFLQARMTPDVLEDLTWVLQDMTRATWSCNVNDHPYFQQLKSDLVELKRQIGDKTPLQIHYNIRLNTGKLVLSLNRTNVGMHLFFTPTDSSEYDEIKQRMQEKIDQFEEEIERRYLQTAHEIKLTF